MTKLRPNRSPVTEYEPNRVAALAIFVEQLRKFPLSAFDGLICTTDSLGLYPNTRQSLEETAVYQGLYGDN